jgi:hypothetical protein
MQHLKVEGDAYERALQQAHHFGRKALTDARTALGRLAVFPARMPQWMRAPFAWSVHATFGRLYHLRHAPVLREYQGGKFRRALEGLAEGFGEPDWRMYGFAAFEIEASRFRYTLGCTSMAFAADATASGRPVLAYNHDFPPSFAPFPFVRESVPDEGLPSVVITYPPMLGAICGVNAAGLAVSLNHAWVRRLSMLPALPISMLVQDVLDRCTSVEEAIEAVKAVKVPNGSMMTLADARSDRAAIELTPAGCFVRRSKNPVLHTFNAYQTDGARRLEVPVGAIGLGPIDGMDIHACNLGRQARWEELGAASRRGWTTEDVDALMGDHGSDGKGCANTICRHDDEASITLLTARVDPVARTLVAGLGHACDARLHLFDVPAVYRRAA